MTDPKDRQPSPTEVSPAGSGDGDAAEPQSATAESDRLTIGQRLSGRYRVEREIGEGGMGIVYFATDEQVRGETFAIKLLKERLSAEALELLREEVRKTRKLSHPNIVDVHSVNIDGTRLYVLMEYLEGKPLNALLDEEFSRGMPLSRAGPIIEDACAALGYAHDHSIIHSDLKPANVFVTTSGKTKLLDFGIARASRGPLKRKQSGSLVLTPAYASCEMLVGDEADRRDDIYALGCLIYEMLSGERPFGRFNALEARAAKLKVTPLSQLSRRQNRALTQALAFDRKQRTTSVEQLLADLSPGKATGDRRKLGYVTALIGAVALLGLSVLILDWMRSSKYSVTVQAPVTGAASKSIAVLPFLDLSGEQQQRYFADGLTTALIDRLTLFPGLSVTGQTSSFAVKDSKEDAPTLARRLHVEYLLEGTVRGSADQLRVSSRLIRAEDGFELWSQVFERSGSELLTLQEDIARAVILDLHGSLLDVPAPVSPSTRSLEAYRLLLQAEHQDAATDDERALIEAALRKDPDYVNAWVDLGTWWYDSMLTGKVVTQTAVPLARAAYDRALALDKTAVDAYLGMAWLQMSQLDWSGAQGSVERVDSLDPASLSLLTVRGELARSAGDWKEAIRLERERLQRDPLSVGTRFVLAQSYLCAGEYQKAEETVRQTITENPKYLGPHALLGRSLAAQGEAAAALKVIDPEPDESARLAGLASIQFDLGHRDASDAALTELRSRYGKTLPGLVGLVYAHRQELAPAFQWLQQALDQRQPEFAAGLACTPEPAYARLRGDPRFAALRGSLGFNP